MPGNGSILFRVLFVAGNEATILGAGRHPGLHSVTDFAYHSLNQPLAVLAASPFIAALAHFHVLRATAGHDHSMVVKAPLGFVSATVPDTNAQGTSAH